MRRIAIICGCVVAVILAVLVAAVVVTILLDDPKARVSAVEKCFDEVPDVKLTYISDLTKQASQSITAYVEVEGKGEIGFTGLGPKAFGESSHIALHGIGPYNFRTRQLVKEQESYGYAIDIGTASPIPAARKLGITNVQSAIAQYDELLALIAHWPVTTNEWPSSWPARKGEWPKVSAEEAEEIHFSDLPRGDYYFCLKRSDGDAGLTGSGNTPPGYNYGQP